MHFVLLVTPLVSWENPAVTLLKQTKNGIITSEVCSLHNIWTTSEGTHREALYNMCMKNSRFYNVNLSLVFS